MARHKLTLLLLAATAALVAACSSPTAPRQTLRPKADGTSTITTTTTDTTSRSAWNGSST